MDDQANNQPLSATDEVALAEALKKAQNISNQIIKANNDFKNKTDELKDKINAGLDEIDKLDSELQDVEQKTADELDKLILEQAEDLSSEEE